MPPRCSVIRHHVHHGGPPADTTLLIVNLASIFGQVKKGVKKVVVR